MPEAPTKKKGGNPLKKKVGPLPGWGWLAVGGGTFLAYRFIHGRRAASTASLGSALTGGTTIPNPSGSAGTSTPSFSTLAQWQAAAIAAMSSGTLSPADAMNGITDWINGQCVSAEQFKGISSIIGSIGLPPGFSTVPVLSVCTVATAGNPTQPAAAAPAPAASGTPGTQPGLDQATSAAMQANGESVVSSAWDPIYQDWVYLTNKGGVYNVAASGGQGGGYLGSYLGLPSSATQVAPGAPQRTFSQITVDPQGGYTLTATDGATYHFGP